MYSGGTFKIGCAGAAERGEGKMKIITVEDAMHEYGLSRKFITKLLNTKGCPILPRKKGQHYRILKDVFEEWLLAQKK